MSFMQQNQVCAGNNPEWDAQGKWWDNTELYQTSTVNQSAKNTLAMKNSTEQLLKTKSQNLISHSPGKDAYLKKVDSAAFQQFDRQNLFKTSYGEMTGTDRKRNDYYLPKFSGFVPGMKSENPFGGTFTRLAQIQAYNFENRKDGQAQFNYNRPMSKEIGGFWKGKNQSSDWDQLMRSPYDDSLRQSGFSINLLAKSPAGFVVPGISGNNTSTEYRMNYDKRRHFQYTGPMFSTGLLKNVKENQNLI